MSMNQGESTHLEEVIDLQILTAMAKKWLKQNRQLSIKFTAHNDKPMIDNLPGASDMPDKCCIS
jgi:hypothetical protein